MSVPQWNADIITPASNGTQVIGDNDQPQETLEGGDNITIEDGVISATGGLEQEQANWAETDTEDPSFIRNKPTIPSVDQTYDATSSNAQSGVAVAEAVGGVAAVPSVTSTDDGKILKASYDSVAGTGSFAWETQTTPTVDQVYDASSTNAQSGTAVAGALAGVNQVPASTSSDANKVLTVDSQGVPGWVTPATPAGGDSDEWWGGDPGRITLPKQTLRLKFKDLTYDPRNETDTSFTDHFQSITKVEDGVYDFLFANDSRYNAPMFYESFTNKYLTDNEFIVVAFNFGTATSGRAKNMNKMFNGCTGLKAVYNVQDTDSYNRDGLFDSMFYGCTGLVYFSVINTNRDFRISSVKYFRNMFKDCYSLVDCNLVITRVLGTADCSNMFDGCSSLVTGPSVDNGVSYAAYMFSGCRSLRGFHLNNILGVFDIPADTVCNCDSMFSGCESLESSDIPFFLYHTVSDASNMFKNCRKMTTPPRHIKVASSLNAEYMFDNCWALESLPDMDYGAITTISNMFDSCVMLPDISKLATVTWNASLTSVGYMFRQCWGIEKGLKDVYDNMAATATITSHSNTFTGCGTAFSNPDLALIPTSWGGGAA